MTARPILFRAEMVRALLDGRKTQTRRVVKPQPPEHSTLHQIDDGLLSWFVPAGGDLWPCNRDDRVRCPYGAPGDLLWVKHAFADMAPYLFPVRGAEGVYSAGSDGLIYRVDGESPRPLQGTPQSKGYLTVTLSIAGTRVTKFVHKLVCEAFYGPPPEGLTQVRHLDGNQLNNLPENLDWGSPEQNWGDRKVHGGGMGEAHHSAKLSARQIKSIRASNLPQRALAERFGVSQSQIWCIKNGRTWAEGIVQPGRNTPAFRPWSSSRFMPRWASRLTLRITGVRVERVQEISHDDAVAEGVPAAARCERCHGNDWPEVETAQHHFRDLWDSMRAGTPFAWAENPWVWVVEFEVIKANVDSVLKEVA